MRETKDVKDNKEEEEKLCYKSFWQTHPCLPPHTPTNIGMRKQYKPLQQQWNIDLFLFLYTPNAYIMNSLLPTAFTLCVYLFPGFCFHAELTSRRSNYPSLLLKCSKTRLNKNCLIGHVCASIRVTGNLLKGSAGICGCYQTKPIHPYDYYSWDFVFFVFFSKPDATSITSLPQLFPLSSGPATQTHSAVCQSQQSPQKSNPPSLLMGCDIALIISRAPTVGECGKQAVDTPLRLCQRFHSNESEWITSCQINRLH